MSLNERVQQALAENLAEQGGGMVTGFYLVADVIDDEGGHGWLYATAPDQPLQQSIGLVEWARDCCRYEQWRHLEDGGDR